jgi:flavin-binding protein dodecin
MNGFVWKVIEILGESKQSFADATRNAIDEAGKTVKHAIQFAIRTFQLDSLFLP